MNTNMQNIIEKTGEIMAKPEPVEIGTIAPEIFTGISTLDIAKDISDKLTASVPLEGIEIKPTGQIYLCHIQYRRMLNDAFGMGNWALRPLGGFTKVDNIVCREYALYIRGKYAASAIGEQAYIESNDQMTWSDACEATKSNAIMRCCKDLGIGLEMWDKKFVEKFVREFCVQVWRKGKSKPQYRLKSSEPWFDETGIVDPSKKQAPVQSESPESPRTEGVNPTKFITGISNITSKTGKKKDGNPHKIYTIYGEGDAKYNTFDENVATLAKTAKESGLKVSINTKGDKYNTIATLDIVEPVFIDLLDPIMPVDDIPEGDLKF